MGAQRCVSRGLGGSPKCQNRAGAGRTCQRIVVLGAVDGELALQVVLLHTINHSSIQEAVLQQRVVRRQQHGSRQSLRTTQQKRRTA